MNSDTWDTLSEAITKLLVAFDALETDEARKAPLITAVTDAMPPVAIEKVGAELMLHYLEAYTGQMLGRAAGQLPTQELARGHFDALLDAEQPRIFETIRQFFPSGNPALERFAMHSCDRLRSAGYAEID